MIVLLVLCPLLIRAVKCIEIQLLLTSHCVYPNALHVHQCIAMYTSSNKTLSANIEWKWITVDVNDMELNHAEHHPYTYFVFVLCQPAMYTSILISQIHWK